jgi:DNA-binding transcriptional MerR regulator
MSRKQAANCLEMTIEGVRHLQSTGTLIGLRDVKGNFRFDAEVVHALKIKRQRAGVMPRHTKGGLATETAARSARRRLAREEKQAAEAEQREIQRIEREREDERRREAELARTTFTEWEAAEALGITVNDVRTLERRGRLRSVGPIHEPRYEYESVEKLHGEFVELDRGTLTASQASKLLECARADVRLLAREGLVQEHPDPLGEPRYSRDDVTRLKQAKETRKREEAARWGAAAELSDDDFLQLLAALFRKW